MSQENEQRLRFRDAMASLSAAVNIITTDGPAETLRHHRHGGVFGDRYAADAAGVHQPQQRDEPGVSGKPQAVRQRA